MAPGTAWCVEVGELTDFEVQIVQLGSDRETALPPKPQPSEAGQTITEPYFTTTQTYGQGGVGLRTARSR